jgi:pimeloyl-ACP methyl ester carboxylesterase
MTMATTTASKVRSKDGTQIAFDRTGDGPAIVLVDGAISHRAISPFAKQIATLLAPAFAFIAYDRRGRGESGDTPPYAVDREIEDLEAVIDEAGGSAFVVGVSSGAVLALDAAAKGLAITKLALYEPPFIVDASRAPLPADYVKRLTEYAKAGRGGDAVELFMTAAVGMPAQAVAGMRSMPMWPALEAVGHTIAYDGTIMGQTMSGKPLPKDRWANVRVPTLVMDGGASPDWQHNAVEAVTKLLPNARRRTIEGQTHDVSADALAPALREFFAS